MSVSALTEGFSRRSRIGPFSPNTAKIAAILSHYSLRGGNTTEQLAFSEALAAEPLTDELAALVAESRR